MFSLSSKQSSSARVIAAGMLALLLLAALPLAAAASHSEIRSYSGDDAYDPAAGGLDAVSTAASSSEAVARFHEAKTVDDPANGAWSFAQAEFYLAQLSADVAVASSSSEAVARFYEAKTVDDPANGAWSIAQAEFYLAQDSADGVASSTQLAASYSGDDAYDPAAGGLDAVSTFSFAASEGVEADCDTPDYAIAGSYSGDDAYDPAAGGNPDGIELALVCVAPSIATP